MFFYSREGNKNTDEKSELYQKLEKQYFAVNKSVQFTRLGKNEMIH